MVTTSKCMHREVQITHDLMTRKWPETHETSGLCEKMNSMFSSYYCKATLI